MLQYIVVLFISLVNCQNFEFNKHPSCFRNNTSCSGFLGSHYPAEFCQQTHYGVNNSSVCNTKYDRSITRSQDTNLGTLILTPFYGYHTIFNITFVDIRFRKLLIYFQEYTNSTNMVVDKCNLKDFKLNGSVGKDSFSYVCPWSDASFEGNEVEFHYEYGREDYETRKKFRFKVPYHTDLDDKSQRYFLYVDITDLSNLTLNIVPLYGFNVTDFTITVLYINENITTVETSVNVSGYVYSHQTSKIEGEYMFRVNCNGCEEQESVRIRLVFSSSDVLIIGMVGVSILIPVFIIIIYMWTGKCPYKMKERPYVLLVTAPTNNAHYHVGPAFAKFLKQFHIEVLLDVNELITDGHRGHVNWLKEKIAEASHIMYLRSRDDIADERITYRRLFKHTVDLENSLSKKQCIINFSYSSERKLSDLVHVEKSFKFPEDLNLILKFLIGVKVVIDLKNDCYKNLKEKIDLIRNEPSVQNEVIIPLIPIVDNNEEVLDIEHPQYVDVENEIIVGQEEAMEGINLLPENENEGENQNESDSESDDSDPLEGIVL